jgi:hypothetical protein
VALFILTDDDAMVLGSVQVNNTHQLGKVVGWLTVFMANA